MTAPTTTRALPVSDRQRTATRYLRHALVCLDRASAEQVLGDGEAARDWLDMAARLAKAASVELEVVVVATAGSVQSNSNQEDT